MKSICFFLILLPILSHNLYGQSTTKCSMASLLEVSKHVGRVTHEEMVNFLVTFDPECRNNVEYFEWSNELLFELLEKQTELTARTIANQAKRIDLTTIFENLEDPILDRFNIKTIIGKVEKINFNQEIKKEIIDRLKKADGKMN